MAPPPSQDTTSAFANRVPLDTVGAGGAVDGGASAGEIVENDDASALGWRVLIVARITPRESGLPGDTHVDDALKGALRKVNGHDADADEAAAPKQFNVLASVDKRDFSDAPHDCPWHRDVVLAALSPAAPQLTTSLLIPAGAHYALHAQIQLLDPAASGNNGNNGFLFIPREPSAAHQRDVAALFSGLTASLVVKGEQVPRADPTSLLLHRRWFVVRPSVRCARIMLANGDAVHVPTGTVCEAQRIDGYTLYLADGRDHWLHGPLKGSGLTPQEKRKLRRSARATADLIDWVPYSREYTPARPDKAPVRVRRFPHRQADVVRTIAFGERVWVRGQTRDPETGDVYLILDEPSEAGTAQFVRLRGDGGLFMVETGAAPCRVPDTASGTQAPVAATASNGGNNNVDTSGGWVVTSGDVSATAAAPASAQTNGVHATAAAPSLIVHTEVLRPTVWYCPTRAPQQRPVVIYSDVELCVAHFEEEMRTGYYRDRGPFGAEDEESASFSSVATGRPIVEENEVREATALHRDVLGRTLVQWALGGVSVVSDGDGSGDRLAPIPALDKPLRCRLRASRLGPQQQQQGSGGPTAAAAAVGGGDGRQDEDEVIELPTGPQRRRRKSNNKDNHADPDYNLLDPRYRARRAAADVVDQADVDPQLAELRERLGTVTFAEYPRVVLDGAARRHHHDGDDDDDDESAADYSSYDDDDDDYGSSGDSDDADWE